MLGTLFYFILFLISIYIHFRRSRDCLWILCVGSFYSQLRATFTYFGEVLRCPHKRIVPKTKVFIARNNINVEIILFRKKLVTLFTFETLKWKPTFATAVLIAIRTFRNIVSSGQVISGHTLFGSAQLHYFKLLCTGSSHGKPLQAPIRL